MIYCLCLRLIPQFFPCYLFLNSLYQNTSRSFPIYRETTLFNTICAVRNFICKEMSTLRNDWRSSITFITDGGTDNAISRSCFAPKKKRWISSIFVVFSNLGKDLLDEGTSYSRRPYALNKCPVVARWTNYRCYIIGSRWRDTLLSLLVSQWGSEKVT